MISVRHYHQLRSSSDPFISIPLCCLFVGLCVNNRTHPYSDARRRTPTSAAQTAACGQQPVRWGFESNSLQCTCREKSSHISPANHTSALLHAPGSHGHHQRSLRHSSTGIHCFWSVRLQTLIPEQTENLIPHYLCRVRRLRLCPLDYSRTFHRSVLRFASDGPPLSYFRNETMPLCQQPRVHRWHGHYDPLSAFCWVSSGKSPQWRWRWRLLDHQHGHDHRSGLRKPACLLSRYTCVTRLTPLTVVGETFELAPCSQ